MDQPISTTVLEGISGLLVILLGMLKTHYVRKEHKEKKHRELEKEKHKSIPHVQLDRVKRVVYEMKTNPDPIPLIKPIAQERNKEDDFITAIPSSGVKRNRASKPDDDEVKSNRKRK